MGKIHRSAASLAKEKAEARERNVQAIINRQRVLTLLNEPIDNPSDPTSPTARSRKKPALDEIGTRVPDVHLGWQ